MAERGVSTVVNYVLVLAILTLLTVGLFGSMTTFVEAQRDDAVRSELAVVGNRLAADIDTAGRLAALPGENGTVEASADVPSTVAGSQYRITVQRVDADGRYRITLRTVDPDVTVTVKGRSAVPVENTTVHGGELQASTTDDGERVVVENG